jgi:hypothetical protein
MNKKITKELIAQSRLLGRTIENIEEMTAKVNSTVFRCDKDVDEYPCVECFENRLCEYLNSSMKDMLRESLGLITLILKHKTDDPTKNNGAGI